MSGEVMWTEDSDAHIARHHVQPPEVEQSLYSRPRLTNTGLAKTTLVPGAGKDDRPGHDVDDNKLNELHDYDNTDGVNEFTDVEVDTRSTGEVMVSTSIRLPQSLVDKVGEQAAALGVPATTLMRQWVIEKETTRRPTQSCPLRSLSSSSRNRTDQCQSRVDKPICDGARVTFELAVGRILRGGRRASRG